MKKKDKGLDKVQQPISLQLLLNKRMNTLLAFSDANVADIDKAIHDIRKSLKDIMAVLMLYKKQITSIQFFTWKQLVKGILKHYSSLREAFVFTKTLNAVKSKINEFDESRFDEIKNHFELKYRFKVKKSENLKETIRLAHEKIVIFSDAIRNSNISAPVKYLKKRNRGILKKTRRLFEKLTLTSSSKDYHTLRKWSKYYDYQKTVFDNLGVEKVAIKEKKRFHELAEYLGDEHDLQLFYDYLKIHFTDFSEIVKPYFSLKINKLRKKILVMYPKI